MPEAQPSPRLRLFVALTLPEVVKEQLAKAQAELRRALGESSARWARAEEFHLTLRFLGNVEAERVQPLADSISAACRDIRALRLRASGVGFFPNARRPRVVWAGIADAADTLPVLHERIQQATNPFTLEEPEQRYASHITLGRTPGIGQRESAKLAEAAGTMANRNFGEWTASEVHLVRSELSPKGSRYTSIQLFPLV